MPLNIEFCLRAKIEMKHNPVASVLLPSGSRQRGFKKNKNKTKAEMAESKAECQGEVELSQLMAEAGRDLLKENIETVDQRRGFYCFELLWKSNSADGKESVRIPPRR